MSSWGVTGNVNLSSNLIQFTYGTPFTLSFASAAQIDAGDYVASATPYDLHAVADFGHTIQLTNFQVFIDAAGSSPAAVGSVGSESGTTYAVVPEPCAAGLLCVVVGATLRRTRRSI